MEKCNFFGAVMTNCAITLLWSLPMWSTSFASASLQHYLIGTKTTNAAATVKMRSGRLVMEAEAALHSKETHAPAATEIEHTDGRLVGAAAAHHSDADTNTAAAEAEQADTVKTQTPQRNSTWTKVQAPQQVQNLGEDTNAAVACNLSERQRRDSHIKNRNCKCLR